MSCTVPNRSCLWMKAFLSLSILFIGFLSPKLEAGDALDRAVREYELALQKETKLTMVRTFGVMDRRPKHIELNFEAYKVVTILEARRLLVEAVEGFRDIVESDQSVRDELCGPFNFNNFRVQIKFVHFFGQMVDRLYVESVTLENGVVFYDAFDCNWSVACHSRRETYDQALHFIELEEQETEQARAAQERADMEKNGSKRGSNIVPQPALEMLFPAQSDNGPAGAVKGMIKSEPSTVDQRAPISPPSDKKNLGQELIPIQAENPQILMRQLEPATESKLSSDEPSAVQNDIEKNTVPAQVESPQVLMEQPNPEKEFKKIAEPSAGQSSVGSEEPLIKIESPSVLMKQLEPIKQADLQVKDPVHSASSEKTSSIIKVPSKKMDGVARPSQISVEATPVGRRAAIIGQSKSQASVLLPSKIADSPSMRPPGEQSPAAAHLESSADRDQSIPSVSSQKIDDADATVPAEGSPESTFSSASVKLPFSEVSGTLKPSEFGSNFAEQSVSTGGVFSQEPSISHSNIPCPIKIDLSGKSKGTNTKSIHLDPGELLQSSGRSNNHSSDDSGDSSDGE